MVGEGLVLLRIEDFEQRGRGVALVACAELVDLVEHHHRIRGAHPFQGLHDATRQRADVRAPVTPDLGLVADASERDADELAPHRPGDALAERGLSHAGRPGQAEDRPLQIAAELADGEKLEHALLHLLETMVIGVEDLAGIVNVQVVLRDDAPGQIGNPLQPGPRHGALRRLLRQLLQPGELLVDLRPDVFRQLQR